MILRKIQLIEEIRSELGNYSKVIQEEYSKHFTNSPNAKISRGENYQSFPYLVLDYPRIFSEEKVLAYRILFWWGHFISATIHLKGEHLKKYGPPLLDFLTEKKVKVYFSYSGDEWNHDIDSNDYQTEAPGSLQKIPHLKISMKLPLAEFNNLDAFLKQAETTLLKPLL